MSMLVNEIMNRRPVCCAPDMSIREAAQMMVKYNCGAIPVAADAKTCRPVVGIVTDRDIVCRAVAQGKNPLELRIEDCMSASVATVSPEDTVEHCCDVMEQLQVRRLPVVDQGGALVGIITQAHIALNTNESKTGEMLKGISKRTDTPSRISVGPRS